MTATLCHAMLPVHGKTRQLCCTPRGSTQGMFLKILIYVSKMTQNLCRTQMLRAWQNESTFVKHDHVGNVSATMCPRLAGPLSNLSSTCTHKPSNPHTVNWRTVRHLREPGTNWKFTAVYSIQPPEVYRGGTDIQPT